MRKLLLIIALIFFCLSGTAQKKAGKIPVTTSSKKALSFYNEAWKASEDVDIPKFNELSSKALAEDPDFFMAHYQRAIYAAYFGQEKNLITEATAAVNCKAKISPGEKVLKDALASLLADRKADLTGFGKKLVEMYPGDVNSYLQLMTFQALIKDYDGEILTINNALKLADRKDYLYNVLAYAHMAKGQYKESEAALDKYIAISPQLPNPYDSKGDLYMMTKEYDKAYENFMKAYSIDTTWSKGKALKAKSLAAQLTQAEMMKKFYGTWHRGGKDTVYVFEMHEYNNAVLQIFSSKIKGVKKIQYTCTYSWDPKAGSYRGFTMFAGGQTQTWRVKSPSDKETYFDQVSDLETNNVLQRRIVTFTDADHMIVNLYNKDKVHTGTAGWARVRGIEPEKAAGLIGTYEYYGNQKGMSVWDDSHFVWALEEKLPVTDSQVTPQDRIQSLNMAGGTWTMQDSIVTCTYQYNVNPKLVGTSFRFKFSWDGDIINSRFIDGQGNIIGRVSARKIK